MTNVAVILAGGTGSRMGADRPKQFLPINPGDQSPQAETVIEHTVKAFEAAPTVDEITIVVHPEWEEYTHLLAQRNDWHKVKRIIQGGDERYMSSLNAIAAHLDYPDDTNLLLHDAARPWVSGEVIARVTEALKSHEAVAVGIPSTDTVWEVRQDFDRDLSKFIARIPERRTMWRAQTPQAFRLPLIRDAYQCALQDPQFHATDDCGVVRRYLPGTKIIIVPGEEQNRKITFADDLR